MNPKPLEASYTHTSEAPETSVLERSTRRIQLCEVKKGHFSSIFKNSSKKKDITFYLAPLDAPGRELFICIFKSAVALLVLRQIIFVCVCTGHPIQLYSHSELLEPISIDGLYVQ